MPIEIKEMHIKINVNEGSTAAPKQKGNGNDLLLQECMERVAKMVKNKKER